MLNNPLHLLYLLCLYLFARVIQGLENASWRTTHDAKRARFKGKRNKGTSRPSWIDNINEDITSLGIETLRQAINSYNQIWPCSFIHSFRLFLLHFFRSTTTQKRSRLQHGYCVGVSRRSATSNCDWRTCPRSLRGARVGFEPATLRTKGA